MRNKTKYRNDKNETMIHVGSNINCEVVEEIRNENKLICCQINHVFGKPKSSCSKGALAAITTIVGAISIAITVTVVKISTETTTINYDLIPGTTSFLFSSTSTQFSTTTTTLSETTTTALSRTTTTTLSTTTTTKVVLTSLEDLTTVTVTTITETVTTDDEQGKI